MRNLLILIFIWYVKSEELSDFAAIHQNLIADTESLLVKSNIWIEDLKQKIHMFCIAIVTSVICHDMIPDIYGIVLIELSEQISESFINGKQFYDIELILKNLIHETLIYFPHLSLEDLKQKIYEMIPESKNSMLFHYLIPDIYELDINS